jgi:hypothetical protein
MPEKITLLGWKQTPYHGYSTALEALCYAAEMTWGQIIEFGTGYYSTPILTQLARIKKTTYKGWDTNQEWVKLFQDRYKVKWVRDFMELPVEEAGLVFVDGDVKPSNRQELAMKWIDHAEIVVCHDTEPENAHKYGPYDFSKVKYVKNFTWQWPNTTLLSNRIKL